MRRARWTMQFIQGCRKCRSYRSRSWSIIRVLNVACVASISESVFTTAKSKGVALVQCQRNSLRECQLIWPAWREQRRVGHPALHLDIRQKKTIDAQSMTSVRALAENSISSMRMEHPILNARSYKSLLGSDIRLRLNVDLSSSQFD